MWTSTASELPALSSCLLTSWTDDRAVPRYSPPAMSSSNLVLYGAFVSRIHPLLRVSLTTRRSAAQFAIYSATVVHTILYHSSEIGNGFKVCHCLQSHVLRTV